MRSDGDVIATRRFQRDDGDVVLELERPAPYPDERFDADPSDPPWRCDYEITFSDGERKRSYAVGIDGIQAIFLALRSAEASLTHFANGTPAKRPEIRWNGEGDLGLTFNNFDQPRPVRV